MRSPVPLVVTFHDLAVLRHPQTFNRWTRNYSALALPRVARARDAIIAGSEFTSASCVDLLDVPEEKVRVIPNGVGAAFEPTGQGRTATTCSRSPRSSRARTCPASSRAFAELGSTASSCGSSAPRLGDVRIDGDGIRAREGVDDEELARLYRGAACVAYVSLYEGFGLPVLEAMACATPVVAGAATRASKEIAGSAAVLVDPLDPDAIAAGIARGGRPKRTN